MESAVAARIFHDWAYKEGLLDEKAAPIASDNNDYALIQGVDERGVQLLRQKRVRFIGFDPATGRVIVYTKKAAPTSKRQLALLPTQIDDVEMVYRQGVPVGVEDQPPHAQGAPAYSVWNSAGLARYTCGSSISVGNNRDAGTLGCLVRGADGTLYGLTNNHVSGGCSYADVGLPIVAPGIFDVIAHSLDPFTIGYHHQSLQLTAGSPDNVDPKLNLDAAIFKIRGLDSVSSHQRDAFDTPAIAGPLTAGMTVQKVGRTTGLTEGMVVSQVYGASNIQYQAQLYGFTGNVYFDPLFSISGITGLFSDSGDSGSLITTVDAGGQRIAVGIVVGGMTDSKSPGGKTTLALPLQPILAGLGVTLVSAHNV